MEWLLDDPVRGKPTAWWSIDPQTGRRTAAPTLGGVCNCLGDSVLADVAMVALNIEGTFGASRYFSDEEVRSLLLERQVPRSVREHPEAASELLESVDDLWHLVEDRYQQAWGRSATQAERHWLYAHAFDTLRSRKK